LRPGERTGPDVTVELSKDGGLGALSIGLPGEP
jgi:hypothetical protein